MASGKYETLSQTILNWIFNGGSWTQPTIVAIALYTTTPAVASTGTEVPNAGGYARLSLAVTDGHTNFATISGSTTTVTSQIDFVITAGASATWASGVNVTGVGICTSASYGGGSLWYFGDVTTPKPVYSGDPVKILAGNLTIQEL